ncbi:hypothetical protein CYY_000219 [Polysphondylium violaceum]|uniref:Uncharacterized protein n=1 Tax=Polysphondylium violaceum TaxID=133409 RepID=A0A8J4Q420_9MYCE|nr:hypothetical protein CYY_000219 [Polysphondylium violaceum]
MLVTDLFYVLQLTWRSIQNHSQLPRDCLDQAWIGNLVIDQLEYTLKASHQFLNIEFNLTVSLKIAMASLCKDFLPRAVSHLFHLVEYGVTFPIFASLVCQQRYS